VSTATLQLTRGLGWPQRLGRASSALGWPVRDSRAQDTEVSRETETLVVADVAPRAPEPAPEDAVSRETEVPKASAAHGDSAAAEEALAAVVSRETADRDELASSLPRADHDTPLAQAVAADARKRIALTGRVFPKPPATRVLTVANQKGGVGKTTTTVNVAAALAQAGLTVLVIDIDPQGNASTALGIDHHADVPSIYDVLVEGTAMIDVVQECPDIPGLWCAPATIDLAGAEIELVSLVARETRLQKAIAAYLDHFATSDQAAPDYVLIDCPPSLGLLTVNAFVAAQEVFIPIQCEYYALEGLSQLLKNIELIRNHLNPTLHVSTILLTMYDGRTRLSAQVADEVRNHFPAQVLRNTVPRSVRISEAPSHGQTVMTYDPNSSGALSYLGAAAELADRGVVAARPASTDDQPSASTQN
jgi:chromosome partitioning protein